MGKIIGVSSNNGLIHWNEVVNDEVTDFITRLSLGYNTKDSMGNYYGKDASSVAIAISYYHIPYPDKRTSGTVDSDARNEACYFTGLFKASSLPVPCQMNVSTSYSIPN